MAKKKKNMAKDALAMGTSAVTMGVMGSAVTQAGGSAAGLNTMSGFMPSMGAAMGAGGSLQMLGNLMPKQAKKRKKR